MDRFWKRFLREHRGPLQRKGSPKIYLGAFGKHPGWNDHIDDIGLETDSLLLARQVIYVDGIGGRIAVGAWEALSEAEHLPGFNHTFLWVRGDAGLVGRIWSSHDGKGRARFPMVLCAHAINLNPPKALISILPLIESAESRCRATTRADEVRFIIDQTREELRRFESANSESNSPTHPPSLGEERVVPILAGVIREAHRSASVYVRHLLRSCRRSGSAHLRVPGVFGSPGSDLAFWTCAMESLFHPTVPLLLISPDGQEWLDAIVGEPTSQDLFCLRASPSRLQPVAPAETGRDRRHWRKAARLAAIALDA
jgi:hypothetical protein